MENCAENKVGILEVICGPMFCGKTEELIRRVRREMIAKRKVLVFKHKLDKRYASRRLATHSGVFLKAKGVGRAGDILRQVTNDTEIVAIDEAQWFGDDLIGVVNELIKNGKKVLVSGLATTYEGEPFAPIPYLMAIADSVTKLSAVCTICGQDAVFHIKKEKTALDPARITAKLVGGTADYEARCRKCFEKDVNFKRS